MQRKLLKILGQSIVSLGKLKQLQDIKYRNLAPLLIVIPTCGRPELLDRTLKSLLSCRPASSLRQIIVAENGERSGTEDVIKRFSLELPTVCSFSKKPNKSHALNQVIGLFAEPNDFVIFFDDDVLISPDTLLAYEKEISYEPAGVFLSGRVWPDYEVPPPAWLHDYLPPSVMGWDLGDEKRRLEKPDALGANWGAFARDLQAVGGFDENFGPGTAARGQETRMQEKLMHRGITGYYLPDAAVWHHVPKERCSEEWALRRVRQMSVSTGSKLRNCSWARKTQKLSVFKLKAFALRLLLALGGNLLEPRRLFHYRYRLYDYQGLLHGATADSLK